VWELRGAQRVCIGETHTQEDTLSSTFRITLALLATLAAGRPSAATAATADVTEVGISEYRYEPRTITVQRGTTIRWVNRDTDPHTVTANDGAFSSRGIDTKEEFTFTFDAPGTYVYHCTLHPLMSGTVVVR
jgi:plastocyanin